MAKTWQRLRGNANGRKPAYWQRKFFCDGCQKEHGPNVERNKTLDGKLLCNRAYYRHLAINDRIQAAGLAQEAQP